METTIVSSEWWIVREFRHSDGVYSPGEPVPELAEAEAEILRQQGVIARFGEEPVVPETAPVSAEDYLTAASDIIVIQRIRHWQPPKATLRKILVAAGRTGRSIILVEALKLALGEPLADHPGTRA